MLKILKEKEMKGKAESINKTKEKFNEKKSNREIILWKQNGNLEDILVCDWVMMNKISIVWNTVNILKN